MRILWVKASKLLPVHTGGRIRSYNILKHLAAHHTVTLLSYYRGRRDEDYEREIEKQFPGTIAVCTGAPETPIKLGLSYLRRFPSRVPFAVAKFTAPEVQRLLAKNLTNHRYDIAVCDFLAPSLNFPRAAATPTVLFQHNVESALWQRQADHEHAFIRRLAFRWEAVRMFTYELKTIGRFDHVVAVSEIDRKQMQSMVGHSNISVVRTGVDLQQFRSFTPSEATAPLVMFVGSMDWGANIDGVEYFCSEIWPRIKAAVPAACFRIVGRNPHPRVKRLASREIEVTGEVPSVIDHLREAAVFVVPLRVGGGTRLKIFEAMAMRRAVVSTSIGAEGLDVCHGRDILLADAVEGFADAVIALLCDRSLSRRLEEAAYETVARYDWPVVASQFEDLLIRIIRDSRASGGVQGSTVRVVSEGTCDYG